MNKNVFLCMNIGYINVITLHSGGTPLGVESSIFKYKSDSKALRSTYYLPYLWSRGDRTQTGHVPNWTTAITRKIIILSQPKKE